MIIPSKLKSGDEIRVIAPARSMSLLSKENITLAKEKLEEQGFKVSFSKHCEESDMFMSSSIESRVEDIHQAFNDKKVKAILTVIGGFNSNQILSYLDYDLIRDNPKILCGYSDITALLNAITTKTGLVTYYGPHFSTWAMKKEFEYNLEYFQKCLIQRGPFEVKPSSTWSDDAWYMDQEKRDLIKNEGFVILNEGKAEGRILGGNLCTFNLLQGTGFMPDLTDSILFIEDDDMAGKLFSINFDRNLQSLTHQPNFNKVKGIVIGKFQKKVDINIEKLKYIISSKKELVNIPIISNVNFGHTNPIITFPIGGRGLLGVKDNQVELRILEY